MFARADSPDSFLRQISWEIAVLKKVPADGIEGEF
jgi:hypothetical protein